MQKSTPALRPRLAFISAATLLATLVCTPSVCAAPPAGYTLEWSDEFDGNSVDTRYWDVLTGGYNNAIRTADAIAVADGVLTISTYTDNGIHNTGFLSTRGKYQPRYGYIEARIDSSVSSGVNHAFWLQSPGNGSLIGDPWNAGIEMDIIEHRAYRLLTNPIYIGNTGTSALHWDGYTSGNHKTRGSLQRGAGLATGFHTYAVEWTPECAAFYIDGSHVWTITNSTDPAEADPTKGPIPERSEFLYLTAAVTHGNFAGAIPAGGYGSLATSTTRMKVDYVRVYQLNPGAPAVPGGLVAGSGDAQASLRWTLSANAATHNIKRSTTRGGPYTTVASGVTGNRYTDSGLMNGDTFYYVVTAVSSSGESASSLEVSAAPMGAFNTLTVDNADAGGVTITGAWTVSTGVAGYIGTNFLHDGNTGANGGKSVRFAADLPATTNYDVYLNWTASSNRGIAIPVDVIHAGGVTSLMVDQTLNGSAWYLLGTFSFNAGTAGSVLVRNDLDGASGFVVADAVKFVQLPLPPPTRLSALMVSGSQIDLAWTASAGAASYDIKRASDSGGPYITIAAGQTATNYSDLGLDANRTYYYVVSAANLDGQSVNSAPVSVRTGPPVPQLPFPPPDELAAVAISSSQIDLSWTEMRGSKSYNIKRATVSGGPYFLLVSRVAATTFSDSGLQPNSPYYYVISTANAAGQGPDSAEISAVTAPTPPVDLTAVAGPEQITLSWSASAGATSYRVKRSGSIGGPYPIVGTTETTGYIDIGLTDGTSYYYVVSAVNATGAESVNSGPVTATPQSTITIVKDNSDATGISTTGAWTISATTAGFYGSSFLHDGNTGGIGGKRVRFTPTIAAAGQYAVYARWTSHSNRASNVPIDINHAAGTATVTVNQRVDGGSWVLLGAFFFEAGTTGSVTLRNDGANGFVVADAVQFVSQ